MGAIQGAINGALGSVQSLAARILGKQLVTSVQSREAEEEAKATAVKQAAEAEKKEAEARTKEYEENRKVYGNIMKDFTKYSQNTYDANQMFNGLTYTLNNKTAGQVQRDSIRSNIEAAKQRKESKVTATRNKVGGRK